MKNTQANNVSAEELTEAFKPEKKPKDKKKIISVVVFIIGMVTLAVGVVFLLLKLIGQNAVQDGDYLVSAKNWVLEDDEKVIWDFEEIGKGTLTTNNHLNDYTFIWALEDGKLKIETDWLYTLDDEYDYTINQSEGKLILNDGEKEVVFKANFETE